MSQGVSFQALQVEIEQDKAICRIVERNTEHLPPGEVLIRVAWSALNYKDALSASGHRGVTRHYPHTPGVDAAGRVAASEHPDFQVGEAVLVTGHDLGMNTDGGFAEYIRVPADWVVKLPPGLESRQAMVLGTAGFTAASAVLRLRENGVMPERGEVLVTGASGGVGSMAVAILAKLGYRVAAVSGKPRAVEVLQQLGASRILSREAVTGEQPDRPLLKARWAGAVDTVGGEMLSRVVRAIGYRGAVAACGLVGGAELSLTVYPFILRGVSLLGIDSAASPRDYRLDIWARLAGDWQPDYPDSLITETDLEGLNREYLDAILSGRIMGRVLVRL